TAWFITISTLVSIALLIYFYRRQIRKKIERVREIEEIRATENERIRRKTADDFHDEMGNKLTRIRVLCDLILRKLSNNSSEEVVNLLQSISENSQHLYNGTRDFIWSIDPNNDSFYELAIRMKDFADEFFDNTGIDFHVRGISRILDNVQLSLDKRRQILLIFKEAMTNILKHSRAKTVTLEFRQRRGHFAVSLSDDGIGFDTAITEGQGLRSIRSRANKIDGILSITSDQHGTKIVFTDSQETTALLYEHTTERDEND
ncbi:MAG: ATP-binding protein, partial [Calditrichaeota bacterium]|nr:ATP-binding protein [Calditrichota bacterium]